MYVQGWGALLLRSLQEYEFSVPFRVVGRAIDIPDCLKRNMSYINRPCALSTAAYMVLAPGLSRLLTSFVIRPCTNMPQFQERCVCRACWTSGSSIFAQKCHGTESHPPSTDISRSGRSSLPAESVLGPVPPFAAPLEWTPSTPRVG